MCFINIIMLPKVVLNSVSILLYTKKKYISSPLSPLLTSFFYSVCQSSESFPELATFLSYLCLNPEPGDQTSILAAVCLGKLCIADDNAKRKLRQLLEQKQTSSQDKAQVRTGKCHSLFYNINPPDCTCRCTVICTNRTEKIYL